jgi:hypothetical protein
VIAEGVEPATSFHYGPYPADKLTYKSKETVEYVTPPNTEGLGTKSFLIKDANPIDGVALLTGEELSLTHLSARLSPEMSDLLPVIIRQVEQDSSQSATSGSATARGKNATPESCAKLGQAYEYHGDTGTSSCVPHAGTQSVPPETSDALPNGIKESPAGCLEATAHTNGPCKTHLSERQHYGNWGGRYYLGHNQEARYKISSFLGYSSNWPIPNHHHH